MKKKLSVFLVLTLFVCMMMIPASAASPAVQLETEIIHTEDGDIEIETSSAIYRSLLRSSSSVKVEKTQTVKYNDEVIAIVTLTTTFSYNGTTARVTSTSSSHETYDGWTYKNEEITTSGGTAQLTAQLSKLFLRTLEITITATCSPTGDIT